MFRIKCKNTASNYMQIAIGVSQMTSYQYQGILLSHLGRGKGSAPGCIPKLVLPRPD